MSRLEVTAQLYKKNIFVSFSQDELTYENK